MRADAFVVDARDHLDLFHLQRAAVDPARRLAQAGAELAGLALQKRDLPRGRRGRGAHHSAAHRGRVGHAPLGPPGRKVEGGRRVGRVVDQELGHIEANAAGADDGHARPHRLALQDRVEVADHARRVLAGDARVSRRDPRGQQHVVEALRNQSFGADAGVQMQGHARARDAPAEVAQGLVKLLLAGDALGQVELAADFGRRLEQVDLVAALGQRGRGGQAGRPGADDRDAFLVHRAPDQQGGFVAGARVDQAARELVLEGVIEAGLVAGDAGVDFVGAAGGGLGDELGIGQERAGQADHVGAAVGEHLLTDFGRVDAVAGDQRDRDARGVQLSAQFLRDPREGRAGYRGGYGRHPRFVPADAGVEDRRPRGRDGLGQLHHLGPTAAVGDQVDQADAVDQDEIRPHRFAHPAHDLDRQAHAVLVSAAPAITAVVGVRDQELVDEVALAAHHLDAVVAGLARQHGAAHEGADLALDAALAQLPRRKGRNRRLDARRRHAKRRVAVAAGVQDLQCDLSAFGVHGIRHFAMAPRRGMRGQSAGKGLGPAFDVGCKAARDHQADTAACPLGVERSHG